MESNRKLREFFDILTEDFTEILGKPKRNVVPYQNLNSNWINLFFESPIFRHIHLQFYKTDRLCIFHANAFPHTYADFPILGYDLIAFGNKISGFFFDMTPINDQILQEDLKEFKNQVKSPVRELPEWANFFGENFICVTPEEDEIHRLIIKSRSLTEEYLKRSKLLEEKYKNNLEIQNLYCSGQKKNEKTFKALASDIGEDNARDFLKNYLFPEIQ